MEVVLLFCIIAAACLRCSLRSPGSWLRPGPRAGLNVVLVRTYTETPPRDVPRFWVPAKDDATHIDGLRAREARNVADGDC